MWGVEHTLMATAVGCLTLWLAWKRNWTWLGSAALSQVPFWVGLAAYMVLGDKSPVGINMCVNLLSACLFVLWAERLKARSCGGVVHVWLCLIFVAAGSVDVLQLVYEFSGYMLKQELFHYLALFTIGGRAYVRRLDGTNRNSRNRSDIEPGRGLV